MVIMMDSGWTIKDMDRENMFGLLVIRKAISMKVNGLMVTEVDMGYLLLLKSNMKGNGWWT